MQTLSEELDRWRNWWHGAHSFLSPGDNSCPSETWEDKSEANIYETMQTPRSRMAVLFSPETPEKKRETPAAGRGVAPISAPYVVLPAEVQIQTKLLMLLFWHDAKISLIASRLEMRKLVRPCPRYPGMLAGRTRQHVRWTEG